MQIDLIHDFEGQYQTDLVEDILQFAAKYLQLSDETECSVSFVSNEAIRQLNKTFRQKDVATDVISFALDDHDDEIVLSEEITGFNHNLGDIIISIEKAQEQAEAYGHSFERELGFLALHGFLHLNGYDHMTQEEEKEMFTLQDDILNAFGLTREQKG